MRARYLMIVPLLAAALLGAGCTTVKAKLDAKFTPPPKVVTVEATVAAAGAPVTGTLAKGFPSTLPLWPGAKLKTSKTTKTPQGNSYSAMFSTHDPYADVLAGIGLGLKNAGFKVSANNASTDNMKVDILAVSNARVEGIITISQLTAKPVYLEYVVTPKKK
jgi:hypothetical protein